MPHDAKLDSCGDWYKTCLGQCYTKVTCDTLFGGYRPASVAVQVLQDRPLWYPPGAVSRKARDGHVS